jgi:hypothetical protein
MRSMRSIGGFMRTVGPALAAFAMTGCPDDGGVPVRSHSTNRAVYDIHLTPAVYHFDQVVAAPP